MKRTIPLLITAGGGFVLVVSFFIPATEGWGEVAAIWFDVLASIAFILGGGNLLKIHLKKISDRPAGWGYSAVTLAAFLATLVVGLAKLGSQPAAEQQFFGETFAALPLDAFPESQIARVEGVIPKKTSDNLLPASVRRQLSEENGKVVFRGWMLPHQKQDLTAYQDELRWQCLVEKLSDQAQPPDAFSGKVAYYADHGTLSFQGAMQDADKQALLEMSSDPAWTSAVEQIAAESRRETRVAAGSVPPQFEIPASLGSVVFFDEGSGELGVRGPLSIAQRRALADQFPVAKPPSEDARDAFRQELEQLGEELSKEQATVFDKVVDGLWTVEQLRAALDAAGESAEVEKTACEMLGEMRSGAAVIVPKKKTGPSVRLNAEQIKLLGQFAAEQDMTPEELVRDLAKAGPLTGPQRGALFGFLGKNPTVGEFRKALCFALLRAGPLSGGQRAFLLDDFRRQQAWHRTVGRLFLKAHTPKYRWSGDYAEQGNPFWWIYEYVFKPLTATMFAMLAFYVASAAFRAFRAKNVEAILLLGTAFIILLGRTFAGVLLTSWLPESVAGLKIENLTVTIMSVFNTAGNRAIMIGIALGIASTSLRVLLGVDRSYLGSQEE